MKKNGNKSVRPDAGIVACEPHAYIGLPFEGGLWSFDGGRELLVAALWNACGYETRQSISPEGVRRGRSGWRTWRSRDGGKSWKADATVFTTADAVMRITRDDTIPAGKPVDPRNPDALLSAVTLRVDGGEHVAVHVSRNRGRAWEGPFLVNVSSGRNRSLGQASACLRADGTALLFLTTSLPNGRLRPCALQLEDLRGRRSLISYLPNHPDMERIWPSPVTLGDGRILVAVTEKPSESIGHTLLFLSEDDGRSWSDAGRPNDVGEPAHLLRLADGRLVLTYGVPLPPFRLCARISPDDGATWGAERTIREGGGSADLGSARSAQAHDGAVVTVCQWNNAGEKNRFGGGRRHLAFIRWRA